MEGESQQDPAASSRLSEPTCQEQLSQGGCNTSTQMCALQLSPRGGEKPITSKLCNSF